MNNDVELITNSEAQTHQLAAELSNYASVGDFFGLTGDLGAGKSVFARAFLHALAGNQHLEVPSPTFTLVQTYEDLRLKASHFDLYRIADRAEVDELGLDDALIDGIALVEWPDRIAEHQFADRLMISIDDVSPDTRKFTLKGHGLCNKNWSAGVKVLRSCKKQAGAAPDVVFCKVMPLTVAMNALKMMAAIAS